MAAPENENSLKVAARAELRLYCGYRRERSTPVIQVPRVRDL
jgi:hypothetical protein